MVKDTGSCKISAVNSEICGGVNQAKETVIKYSPVSSPYKGHWAFTDESIVCKEQVASTTRKNLPFIPTLLFC